MSYSQSYSSWLFDNVIVNDGSVSGSFITFDTAVAQATVGDSFLSFVEVRSGGDLMPPLTSLFLWALVLMMCAFHAAVGSCFFLQKIRKADGCGDFF